MIYNGIQVRHTTMPKQVNLLDTPVGGDVPAFRIPKWLKPNQIKELINGCVSSSEEEESEEDE